MTHARFDSSTSTTVQSSRPLILRQLAMCCTTSLCVSRTSAEAREAVSCVLNAICDGVQRTTRSDSIHTTNLSTGGMEEGTGLRPLLLGPALDSREIDLTLMGLSKHVKGLEKMVRSIYGDSVAAVDATQELEALAALGNGAKETTCKRAALLYALYKEPEVQRYFELQEGTVGSSYAKDMAERVLPFVVPRFLKQSCQAPDAFVQLCVVLADMWPDVRLGNWPMQK
jgi:hypothetical protein